MDNQEIPNPKKIEKSYKAKTKKLIGYLLLLVAIYILIYAALLFLDKKGIPVSQVQDCRNIDGVVYAAIGIDEEGMWEAIPCYFPDESSCKAVSRAKRVEFFNEPSEHFGLHMCKIISKWPL